MCRAPDFAASHVLHDRLLLCLTQSLPPALILSSCHAATCHCTVLREQHIKSFTFKPLSVGRAAVLEFLLTPVVCGLSDYCGRLVFFKLALCGGATRALTAMLPGSHSAGTIGSHHAGVSGSHSSLFYVGIMLSTVFSRIVSVSH